MNSHAVALLQQGRHDEAWRELRSTLDRLRSELQTGPAHLTSENANVAGHPTTAFLQYISVFHDDGIVSPHNVFGFFGSALEFSEHIHSSLELAEASRAVLFNMALTSHIQGLHTGKTTIYFNRALGIYNMILVALDIPLKAQTLLHHNPSSAPPTLATTVTTSFWDRSLELAVHMNMGHIHSHFCNMEETHRCREAIRKIWHAVPNEIWSLCLAVTDLPAVVLVVTELPIQQWAPLA